MKGNSSKAHPQPESQPVSQSEPKPQPQPESQSPIFNDYARYYDLLYRDKDYAAEAEYVAGLIRKFHPSARSILELGSGTGIHASLLAEKGCTVHGIERSPEMLARSRFVAQEHDKHGNPQSPTFIEEDLRPGVCKQLHHTGCRRIEGNPRHTVFLHAGDWVFHEMLDISAIISYHYLVGLGLRINYVTYA